MFANCYCTVKDYPLSSLLHKFVSNIPVASRAKKTAMKSPVELNFRKSLALMFLTLLWISTSAHAGESGNGEGYERLEPFKVNLIGLHQVIQLSATLKMAKPDVGDRIKLYMPAIQHEIILLLSSKTPEQLKTPQGRQELILETRLAANKALMLGPKDGIADVFFESILIQ
jgi:flagellar basal body-associated protein FliL